MVPDIYRLTRRRDGYEAGNVEGSFHENGMDENERGLTVREVIGLGIEF